MSKLIPLSVHGHKHKGKYSAIVDDVDYARVSQFQWSVSVERNNIYAYRHEGHRPFLKTIRLHRFILGIKNPQIGIDHIDRNGLNCRHSNLRIASKTQNARNCRKHYNTLSGFKGVVARGNKFRARIHFDDKDIWLGTFDTPEKAHRAYCIAAKKCFGKFASAGN